LADLLQGERLTDPEADVISFQESIYEYFAREYGTLNVKSTSQLDEKYKSVSVKSLKKSLHVFEKSWRTQGHGRDEVLKQTHQRET